MIISYSNNVKKKFKDKKSIKKDYGELSGSIIFVLSVLIGADNLSQVPNVPPTRRHKLSNGFWAVDLNRNWRLLIRPVDGNEPDSITAIEIIDIVDYH